MVQHIFSSVQQLDWTLSPNAIVKLCSPLKLLTFYCPCTILLCCRCLRVLAAFHHRSAKSLRERALSFALSRDGVIRGLVACQWGKWDVQKVNGGAVAAAGDDIWEIQRWVFVRMNWAGQGMQLPTECIVCIRTRKGHVSSSGTFEITTVPLNTKLVGDAQLCFGCKLQIKRYCSWNFLCRPFLSLLSWAIVDKRTDKFI